MDGIPGELPAAQAGVGAPRAVGGGDGADRLGRALVLVHGEMMPLLLVLVLVLLLLLGAIVELDPHSHALVLYAHLGAILGERSLVLLVLVLVVVSVIVSVGRERHRVADGVRVPHAHDPLRSAKVPGRHSIRPVLVGKNLGLEEFLVGRRRRSFLLRRRRTRDRLLVHDALPVDPKVRIGLHGDFPPGAHDAQCLPGLDEAGKAVLVRRRSGSGAVLRREEGRRTVQRPFPPILLVPVLQYPLVIRLELILVVLAASILPHLLDLSLDVPLPLAVAVGVDGGGSLLGGLRLGVGGEEFVPHDPLIDDVSRVVVVDEFEIGVIRIGVGILRLFFFLVGRGRGRGESNRGGRPGRRRRPREEGRADAAAGMEGSGRRGRQKERQCRR
mmetsp:Transcript_36356/g.109096  ORF Transcript_36356/g.109096 Transcript_36356/m.109096 type:complete len:386 (+) Transcript_36356:1765-2922(+)